MKHDDFKIGDQFWCGNKRWRCTDVGTRVIVAICLEPRETVQMTVKDGAQPVERRFVSDDPSWLIGPPYAICELVFDEYDMPGCSTEGAEP